MKRRQIQEPARLVKGALPLQKDTGKNNRANSSFSVMMLEATPHRVTIGGVSGFYDVATSMAKANAEALDPTTVPSRGKSLSAEEIESIEFESPFANGSKLRKRLIRKRQHLLCSNKANHGCVKCHMCSAQEHVLVCPIAEKPKCRKHRGKCIHCNGRWRWSNVYRGWYWSKANSNLSIYR